MTEANKPAKKAVKKTTKKVATKKPAAKKAAVKKTATKKNEPPKDGRWPKGVSGNPQGRPKKIYTILKDKGFSRDDVKTVFKELAWYTYEEMNEVLADKDAPMIMKVVIRAFQKGMSAGDINSIKQVLEYTLGRPTQRLEHTGEDGAPIQIEEPGDIDYSKLDDDTLRKIKNAKKKPVDGN